MKTKKDFLRVAVHTPLRRTFDYLPNKETELKILKPGIRVSIPFGKQRNASGVIISINSKSEYPYHKLKKINYVIDESPVIDSKHLDLLIWASTYYHHPIGEVIHNALPPLLRKNDNTNKYEDFFWSLSEKNSISIIIDKKNVIIGKTTLDITNDILKIVDEKIGKIKLD